MKSPAWARTADLRYGGQSWEIEVELLDGPCRQAAPRGAPSPLRGRARAPLRGARPSRLARRAARRAACGARPVRGFAVVRRRRPARPRATAGAVGVARRRRGGRARAVARVDQPGAGAWAAARRRVRHDSRRAARMDACADTPRPERSCSSRRRVVPELRERTVTSDPVTLQIVANALQSIADEMATTITRTAHSTVVRDGMDFSSALCDAEGDTIAQAVSVPVPPRLDPDRDGRIDRPLRRAGPPRRRLHHERPLRRGHAPPGHLRRQARSPRRCADRLGRHDGAPRRRRRPTARVERVRQHGDLPGRAPDAVAPLLRGGRARRGGARADRGERAHPAHDLRRPRCAGGGVLRRRARAPGARRPLRHGRTSRS